MSDLPEILKRLADKGLVELSDDGNSVKLTSVGREKVEDELYGDLLDSRIEETK